MKAARLYGYGDVDQLRYEDAPDPEPGQGEVLVRLLSSSINPIDYKLRRGDMKSRVPLQFPAILGRDLAGEVTALGAGVTELRNGDKVMAMAERCHAELVTVKAESLAKIPSNVPVDEAGRLPLILLTGCQLIEKGVQPKARQSVLVTGAFGNVGRSAVFVAKQHGAIVIAGVKASQKKQAQSLGADVVVALDDDRELEALDPFDALADTVNGQTIAKLLPKWNRSGRFASVLGKPAAAEKAGVDVVSVFAQPDSKRLAELAEDVAQGRLQVAIAAKLPLRDIREAHRLAERGGTGKVVLLP